MEGRVSWRFYQAGYGCVLRLQGRRVCHVTRALAAGVSVSLPCVSTNASTAYSPSGTPAKWKDRGHLDVGAAVILHCHYLLPLIQSSPP